MSEIIWLAMKLIGGFMLIGLGVILLLAILVGLFIAPALWPQVKEAIKVRWSRIIAPLTAWRAKRQPSLEVTDHAWENIFEFRTKQVSVGKAATGNVGLSMTKAKGKTSFSYNFITFESGMQADVREWCRTHLDAMPTIHPPYVVRPDQRVRMFLFFASENDAFAFKMRWC